jgi:hypothetical protein
MRLSVCPTLAPSRHHCTSQRGPPAHQHAHGSTELRGREDNGGGDERGGNISMLRNKKALMCTGHKRRRCSRASCTQATIQAAYCVLRHPRMHASMRSSPANSLTTLQRLFQPAPRTPPPTNKQRTCMPPSPPNAPPSPPANKQRTCVAHQRVQALAPHRVPHTRCGVL